MIRAVLASMLVLAGATSASAQASLELGDPSGGARVFAHGEGDHVHFTWRGEGEERSHDCVSPCTAYLEAGRWHARYEELALDTDLTVTRHVVVLEPSGRSDLELGLGLAFVGAALIVAASAIGVDEARCLRGETCEPWVPALLIPSGVALLVGVIMTLDAGGELQATSITPR